MEVRSRGIEEPEGGRRSGQEGARGRGEKVRGENKKQRQRKCEKI